MTTLTFYTDAGHGWLRVSREDCLAIGLNTGSFSRYSYQDLNWLYLEEDCDAACFINRYVERNGHPPPIIDKFIHGNCEIRNKRRI